jgi:hypothetical protein
MTARTPIPDNIQHRVLDRSRRRCALCIHFNNDWSQKEGQLAHLDRDPSNFAEDNLAFLCLPHHDDYDTTRRQTKSLTIREAKTARDRLYAFIEKGGNLATAGRDTMRGPTLEATRDSTIDATGAVIPGDLPFQFAQADSSSFISMPGIKVIQKDDGSHIVTTGEAPPAQFPIPTGEFSSLSNDQLKPIIATLCTDLRELQTRADNNLRKIQRTGDFETDNKNYMACCYEPFAHEYRTKLAGTALSVASECLSRIGLLTITDNNSANMGGQLLKNGAFAGPRPASEIADFLDCLGERLVGTQK